MDTEKDGAVLIRFDQPDPLARVYTWRFRSTFDHPVHVDYNIETSTLRGFPIELQRTVYIPAKGQTDLLGVGSFLEPGINIERVR